MISGSYRGNTKLNEKQAIYYILYPQADIDTKLYSHTGLIKKIKLV
jgi:hypothetical protein